MKQVWPASQMCIYHVISQVITTLRTHTSCLFAKHWVIRKDMKDLSLTVQFVMDHTYKQLNATVACYLLSSDLMEEPICFSSCYSADNVMYNIGSLQNSCNSSLAKSKGDHANWAPPVSRLVINIAWTNIRNGLRSTRDRFCIKSPVTAAFIRNDYYLLDRGSCI